MRKKDILDLPHELTIEILLYCDGVDVLNFADALIVKNTKVTDVISNQKLWKDAVIGPTDHKKYLKYLGSYTRSLKVIGLISPKKNDITVLSESLISSIRLRCTKLESFSIAFCNIDTQVIRFSLFPKTISHLELDNVTLTNLPVTRTANRSSPFFSIKKALPKLKKLELFEANYMLVSDCMAIIVGCSSQPRLDINGEDHVFTFEDEVKDEEDGLRRSDSLSREDRKNTRKLFTDLVDYHYVKRSYNTRRTKPN